SVLLKAIRGETDMKSLRVLLASAGFVLALCIPILSSGAASALSCDAVNLQVCELDQTPPSFVECTELDVEIPVETTDGCDLAIDKQVSINGGPFVEADSSADAANATIGDTVTWQITVTNTSDGSLNPTGSVVVHDVLPTEVTSKNSTASIGEYDGTNW